LGAVLVVITGIDQPNQEIDMPRKNVVKGVLALSAVAALVAVFTVQAQTSTTDTGRQSTSGQTGTSGQSGTTGGTGNSSTTATGQSGTSGSSQAGTSSTDASGATRNTASGGGSTTMLSRADKKMLMDMAQANMAEIEAGRLAQNKSQNEQVKNFAQQMIDDHTKALDDIKQLAQTKGVTLPTELDRTHKAMANKLASLSGDAFDRTYLAKAGVADHKKVHGMLSHTESRAKDPDIRALAARTLPVVDQHLNSAQQLNKNTARGSSSTQGSTGSSTDKNTGTPPEKK
jgi:putative membrane protein